MGAAFLSPDWIEQVEQLRAETDGLLIPPGMGGLAVDLVVPDDPHGDGQYRLEGAPGGLAIRKGHGDNPAATVTMPYELAEAMFVRQDQQAVMTGFTSGQLRVDGDMTKLMALAQGLAAVDSTRATFDRRIQELTG